MNKMNLELNEYLNQPAEIIAPLLLGSIMEREINGNVIRVKIVETEAYDETDAASHSYKGKTQRSEVMFGAAGNLYVYFTYGMHYCCNVVTGPEGTGSAVLIRAVEPLVGTEYIQKLRSKSGVNTTNGPAKLCQALAIDKKLNGHDLRDKPLILQLQHPLLKSEITQTTRIGIGKAIDYPWRFYITGNPYVSKI